MTLDELIELHEIHYAQLINDRAHTKEIEICERTIGELRAWRRELHKPATSTETRLNALIDEHIEVLKELHDKRDRLGRAYKQLDYVRQQLSEGWPIDIRDPEPSLNQIKLEILNGLEAIV